MSVFNLTISYVKPYVSVGRAADLAPQQKALILKSLTALFVLLVSANLYFAGDAVSKSARKAALFEAAGKAAQENGKAEAAFATANYDKTIAYFLSQGYQEPAGLEIIKSGTNVAYR